MILMLITAASILPLAALTWTANRFLPFAICPICAGVSATWLWMIVARAFGYEIDPVLIAVLMGGSVVGIASAAERRLRPHHSPLIWKTLFIPAGFAAVYGIVSYSWITGVIGAAVAIVLAWLFFAGTKKKENAAIKELEKKMKECC